MNVEVTTNVNGAGPERKKPDDDRVFHFCCLGDFSGGGGSKRPEQPLTVTRNSWDGLFDSLKPSVEAHVALPKVDDLKFKIQFRSLKDFSARGVEHGVPFLKELRELIEAIASASAESPVDPKKVTREKPSLGALADLAKAHGSAAEIDLLAMVDIGDEDEDDLSLPNLKSFFEQTHYTGQDRSKLRGELERIRALVLDQVLGARDLAELHGRWRALKFFVSSPGVKLSLLDRTKSELCQSVFETFIKPASGKSQTLDMAIFCDEFELSDDDHHILYHLGRMAESLTVPFLLNTGPRLFGCQAWPHLTGVRDFSGRLNGPGHVKWRKLRDEPGSRWLFLAVNPLRLDYEDESQLSVSAPASFYPAMLAADRIQDGGWPGELLHPGFQLPVVSQCLARLDEEQGYDLSFEGLCAVSGKENGDRVQLLGMLCFASVKMPAREQLAAANLVEYSLSYQFYAGCCSRFLQQHEADPRLLEKLLVFSGVRDPADIQCEEADGQRIFRIQAPFKVFGVHPDLILAIGGAA